STLLHSASREPRAILSFPTRRSSDLYQLHGQAFGQRTAVGQERFVTVLAHAARARWKGYRHEGAAGRQDRQVAGLVELVERRFRSEEHTSELQSRENLVCRLLLEKKK